MESVINKLAEIETAATKIMQAAENQKKLQDEQQEERIAKFDADLEAETAKRIEEITTKLHSTTDADQKKAAGLCPPNLSIFTGRLLRTESRNTVHADLRKHYKEVKR